MDQQTAFFAVYSRHSSFFVEQQDITRQLPYIFRVVFKSVSFRVLLLFRDRKIITPSMARQVKPPRTRKHQQEDTTESQARTQDYSIYEHSQ